MIVGFLGGSSLVLKIQWRPSLELGVPQHPQI